MDFRQLQYMLKVAEEKSFSKAAQKLYIAQPSLSQYIQKLEQQLGVQLFDRSTVPLKLTFAGELYVRTAKQILDLKDQLLQQMTDVASLKKGRLIIGLSPFRSTYVMPKVLPKFREKFPGIEVIFVEGTSSELEDLAIKGSTDITIMTLPIREDIFNYEPIAKEEILVALPANQALCKSSSKSDSSKNRSSVNLKELKDEPFVLLKSHQKLHQIAISLCHQCGFKPNIILESESIEAAHALATAGMGVTFVPDTLLSLYDGYDKPFYFSIQDLKPTRAMVVAYRKDRYLSGAAKEFISTMKSVYQLKIT